MPVMRRLLSLALALTLAVVATGCDREPRTVTVGVDGGSATLAAGERLSVDFGEVNASIGDGWFLVESPDAAVLADDGEQYTSECDMPGCGAQLRWNFTGAAAGETRLVFQYCYRSRPGDDGCTAEPSRGPADPVTLTVTVTS